MRGKNRLLSSSFEPSSSKDSSFWYFHQHGIVFTGSDKDGGCRRLLLVIHGCSQGTQPNAC